MRHAQSVSMAALGAALCICAQPAFGQGAAVAVDDAEAAATGNEGPAETIIVTGTRVSGMTAVESATPIKLLDANAIAKVGQPNLNQVLTQLVPSFTAQAFGGDLANLTLSAKLRGLSPNHTLVLVNGKRRHGTSNLAVLGGAYQGSAAPDLDFITPAAIQRIEVLEQGASAQYGSDAIAGVINIILKDDQGGTFTATGGANYDYGGTTGAVSGDFGMQVGENGMLNINGMYRYHDYTRVGGLDRRVTDASGNLLPGLSDAQRALYANIEGFPYVNWINGDARSELTNLGYNFDYDFGSVQFYSFGTFSRRIASAYENLRVPDRVIASPVLGVRGTLTTPGELVFDPNGFNPREGIREEDYASTAGLKGEIDGLRWDISTTYGQDKSEISTLDSANASLYVDTHFTPTDFYDGFFKSVEWTSNLDLAKDLDVGMPGPLTIAGGLEYRYNSYEIGQGDPGSVYKEGGQSFPGFTASDAGKHSRHNFAAYLDFAAEPVEELMLDAAVRFEDYSDFGTKWTWKLTGRYDFSDAVALRGTVSTGFRAPTLAESYYSATNVSPTSAFVQLPANSAAAKLIGFDDLKPETSTTYSAGLVLRPMPRMTLTIDAYQVDVKDRILGTGAIYGSGGAVNFPVVTDAIVLNGNTLDPTVTFTGINIFTNGGDTRTRGVDVVLDYQTPVGEGNINWTIAGNYNDTKLTRIETAPATLTDPSTGEPIPLFDLSAQSNLTTASPKYKVVTSALYTVGAFSGMLRGTLFGKSYGYASPDGGTYYKQTIPTAFIVDTELSYKLTLWLELSVGANNLLNKKPPRVAIIPGSATATSGGTTVSGSNVLDAPLTFSPYGINGGYYYGRVTFKF